MKKWILTFKIIARLIIKPSITYFSAVEAVCKAELEREPNSFFAMWFLSNLYVEHGKNNEAVIVLESLLNDSKGGDKVILTLARAYYKLAEYNKVYQVLNMMKKIPEKDTANYYLAYSLIELGNINDGIKYLKIYLDHHPKDHLVFCKLGYEYYKQEKHDLALEAYRNAEKLSPLNKEIKDSIDLCVGGIQGRIPGT